MNNTNAYGPMVLRIALGSVLIAHSLYLKLMVYGLAGTAQYFSSIGLPSFLAYVVFLVEAIAGIFLIIGFKTKAVSLAVIPILLGATWAHWQNGWLFSAENGGWEYPLFLTVIAIATALTGAGAHSLDDRYNPKNG
jgi:putative oxidoreductase